MISKDELNRIEEALEIQFPRKPCVTEYAPPAQAASLLPSETVSMPVLIQGRHFYVDFDVAKLHGRVQCILGLPFWQEYSVALGYVDQKPRLCIGDMPIELLADFDDDFITDNLLHSIPSKSQQYELQLVLPELTEVDADGRKYHITADTPICLSELHQQRLAKLLEEYADVFLMRQGLPPERKEVARIDTIPGTGPVFQNCLRLNKVHEEAAYNLIQDLLRRGLIEPTQSAWGSPLFMVNKIDAEGKRSGYRGVIDYRALNRISQKMGWPLPRIDSLIQSLSGSKIFSTCDLQDGFYQMRLNEADQDKSTVMTPWGQYRFLVMPMGISSGPAWFSQLVSRVFGRHKRFTACYIDDLCIHSASIEEHFVHLEAIFKQCRAEGLQLKRKKCNFFCRAVTFLGHVVSAGRVHMLSKHTSQLLVKKPEDLVYRHDLASYLGLCSYYRAFLPHMSSIARSLYQQSATDKIRRKEKIDWTSKMKTDLASLQQSIQDNRSLFLFDASRRTRIRSDASSGLGCGSVLEQYVGLEDADVPALHPTPHPQCSKEASGWVPVEFFSRRWQPAETRYNIYELELYSVILSLEHWAPLIQGLPVHVYVDNQAVTFYETKPCSSLSPREKRWMERLAPFQPLKLTYLKGSSNICADWLSRAGGTVTRISILDLYTGSGSNLRALQHIYNHTSLLDEFDVIDYQGIESDPAKREKINDVHKQLFASGIPLSPDPFRLSGACAHGVDGLVALSRLPIGHELRHALTEVDLLFAGPPCQGVSRAGLGKGLSDVRDGFRTMKELRGYLTDKTISIVESVPGIFDHPHVLQTMEEWGKPTTVRTVGCQARDRVIMCQHDILPYSEEIARGICQAADIPLTWQQALDKVATMEGRTAAIAPAQLCPTLVCRQDNQSEVSGKQLVHDPNLGRTRKLTPTEREAIVGLSRGDTGADKQGGVTLSRTMTGNAIPCGEYIKLYHSMLTYRLERKQKEHGTSPDRMAMEEPPNAEIPSENVEIDQAAVNQGVAPTSAEREGSSRSPQCVDGTIRMVSEHSGPLFAPFPLAVKYEDEYQLVKAVHEEAGHAGHKVVYDLIKASGESGISMQKVKQYLASCTFCLRNRKWNRIKEHQHVLPLPIPLVTFAEVQVDECTGLPLSQMYGQSYDAFVTFIDRYSGFLTAFPFRLDGSTEDMINLMLNFFRNFGIPRLLWVDQGSRFTSDSMKEFADRYGMKLRYAVSKRKETMGQVEKAHDLLQDKLKALLHERQLTRSEWTSCLVHAVISVNNTPKSRMHNFSAAKLAFGHDLLDGRTSDERDQMKQWEDYKQLTDDFVVNKAKKAEAEAYLCNRKMKPFEFHLGDEVLIKPDSTCKLSDLWVGPFTVIEVNPDSKGYKLYRGSGKVLERSSKFLKTYVNPVFDLHSSLNQWQTKDEIYQELQQKAGVEFNFDLCANSSNAKTKDYCMNVLSELSQQRDWNGVVGFMNPPYVPSPTAKLLLKRVVLKARQINLKLYILAPKYLEVKGLKSIHSYPKGSVLFKGETKATLGTKWEVGFWENDLTYSVEELFNELPIGIQAANLVGDDSQQDFCYKCSEIDYEGNHICCDGCPQAICLKCSGWKTSDDEEEYWCDNCRQGVALEVNQGVVEDYLLLDGESVWVRGAEENGRAVYTVTLDSVKEDILQQGISLAFKGKKKQYQAALGDNIELLPYKPKALPTYADKHILESKKWSKDPAVQLVLSRLV